MRINDGGMYEDDLSFTTSKSSDAQLRIPQSSLITGDSYSSSLELCQLENHSADTCEQAEQPAACQQHIAEQDGLTKLDTINQHSQHATEIKPVDPPCSPAQTEDQVRTERQSLSPTSMHHPMPSKTATLEAENVELCRKLVCLQSDQEKMQHACDDMLTDLMTTKESLLIARKELQAKESEASALQAQNQKLRTRLQHIVSSSPTSNRNRSSRSIPELGDVRSERSRLQRDIDGKDEQVYDVQEGVSKSDKVNSLNPSQTQQHQANDQAQPNPETCQSEVQRWRSAYDTLLKVHDKLELSHSGLAKTLAAQNVKQTANEQQMEQLKTSHAAELAQARQISDFFQQHSEELSRNNRAIMQESSELQERLESITLEFEQQKLLIQALWVPVRTE